MNHPLKTKSGATSLYIVVFASLLFTIIAVGFVSLIMSELSQTVNDELSQSAYDAALAGVEDAKLAIIKCSSKDQDSSCAYINTEVGSSTNGGCNTVATILGRTIDSATGGVTIAETSSSISGETLQAYTCVTIKNQLPDYRSYLSFTDTDSLRVVPLRPAAGTDAKQITGVRISWYAATDNSDNIYRNVSGNQVSFAPVQDGVSAPPTIAVSLIQTAAKFTLNSNEIDYTSASNQTDRGTLFLVPSNTTGINHISNSGSTICFNGPSITPCNTDTGFLKANNKAIKNTPYIVRCEQSVGAEFACSVTIQLPLPVGGTRNASTSMLALSMLYDQPSTDFSVELCTDAEGKCETTVPFAGAQYSIDSTGRANDVYSRVETRVELSDIYFPYPNFALQLTGTGDDLIKNFWVANNGCKFSNNSTSTAACSVKSGSLAH